MSEPIKDGGPAFPMDWLDFQPHTGAQVVREQYPGMTLRDYFAATAMNAALCAIMTRGDGPTSASELPSLARRSYQIADAMLAERVL